jgi:hypothetical protein
MYFILYFKNWVQISEQKQFAHSIFGIFAIALSIFQVNNFELNHIDKLNSF